MDKKEHKLNSQVLQENWEYARDVSEYDSLVSLTSLVSKDQAFRIINNYRQAT